MEIETRFENRIMFIKYQVLPAILYEFLQRTRTKQEALALAEKWYRTARGFISQYDLENGGCLIRELNEIYNYYWYRIAGIDEIELQYHTEIYS